MVSCFTQQFASHACMVIYEYVSMHFSTLKVADKCTNTKLTTHIRLHKYTMRTCSKEEFSEGVKKLVPGVEDKHLKLLWKSCDVNRDGKISCNEFMGRYGTTRIECNAMQCNTATSVNARFIGHASNARDMRIHARNMRHTRHTMQDSYDMQCKR